MNGFHKRKTAGKVYPLTVFIITNLPFKVPPPDDDVFGPESEDDDNEVFSSVTVPPVVKTVVRNGNTLVYRMQDQEKPSEPASQSVSHCDTTALP
jgi:hypothetical protein